MLLQLIAIGFCLGKVGRPPRQIATHLSSCAGRYRARSGIRAIHCASRERQSGTGPLGLLVDRVVDSPLHSLSRPMTSPVQPHDERYRVLAFGAV